MRHPLLVRTLDKIVSTCNWPNFPVVRTLGVFVTQRPLSHIRKLDCALGAGIHEPVTADGVELGRSDDFCEFLHIRGLDIHDVEALVLDVEVP